MRVALILAGVLLAATWPLGAATNDLTAALQKGLFEEEANRNLPAAIQAYQGIAARFDEDRRLAATAIFRLGECYRKQGATNDAAAQYERILREFSDQPSLATLSRQNLTGLGVAAVSTANAVADAARQEQKRLLGEEIKLAEKKAATEAKKQSMGMADQDAVDAAQREVLGLKRQLAALDALPEKAAPRAELLDLQDTKTGGTMVTSAENEEITRIRELIKNSPDLINAKDNEGTPLFHAAGSGQLVVARYLLENGADVNARQANRATPLYQAAVLGHRAMVELLLAHGAEVDAANPTGRTPLHAAANAGYKGVAEVLLAHKADPNARDMYGATPLHFAAAAGQAVLVELLLAHQADINAKDTGPGNHGDLRSDAPTRGATPLVVAILRKQPEIVKLLLAHKADIHFECEISDNSNPLPQGQVRGYPLGVAVEGGIPAIVDLLLKAGADPNSRGEVSSNGAGGFVPCTPLLLATWNGSEAIARSLLAAKADPNLADQNGATPLHSAANRRLPDMVRILLANRAEINVQDREGQTPLMRACLSGPDLSIASLLLDHQADPNLQAQDGDTALHFAVRQRRRDLVELLLAKGANPNLRNKQDLTALDELKPSTASLVPPGPFMPAPGLPSPRLGMPSRGGGSNQRAEPSELADLLRQHGASVDVPHLDRIEIRRPASGFAQTVLWKGTNDYNHFTLMELVAIHYGFVSVTPASSPASMPGGGFQGFAYGDPGFVRNNSLGFPNLDQIVIRRATPEGLLRKAIPVNLATVLRPNGPNGCDCSRNPVLEWGDVVEIPEADHPINANWQGLAEEDRTALHQCLDRHVQLTIKGETTNLVLALVTHAPASASVNGFYPGHTIRVTPPAFSLLPVLRDSGLLRASSDLSRVRVRRRDTTTGQNYDLVFDCSDADNSPTFWLREGDAIDVPEKP